MHFLTERQFEDAVTHHLTRPRVLISVFKERGPHVQWQLKREADRYLGSMTLLYGESMLWCPQFNDVFKNVCCLTGEILSGNKNCLRRICQYFKDAHLSE